MPLLNKDQLYFINTAHPGNFFIEPREDIFVWPRFDESPEYYYGISFHNGISFEAFQLDSLLPIGAIDSLKKGMAKLVLSNSHEAFHNVVYPIYNQIVLKYDIHPENIILLSESADILIEVQRISEMLKLPSIKVRWSLRFEHDVRQNKKVMIGLGVQNITLQDKKYEKKFINFNRRWRLHRPALVALLYAKDLIKYGHVSMGEADDHRSWSHVLPFIKRAFSGHPYQKIIEEHETELLSSPPYYVDTPDLIENYAVLTNETNNLYENTYFSVVTETNFFTSFGFESARFLSEKTFKPVAQKHPMIVVSVPHFLDKFREIGYRSFSPWINEEYDTETNDVLRMEKIVGEIERLSNLTPENLTLFLNGVREICLHNFEVMMSRPTILRELN